MEKSKHIQEQIKVHKWWKSNKERIKSRIINSFGLEDTFRL